MKNKSLLTKLFEAKLIIHFIVWFVFAFSLFFFGLYYFKDSMFLNQPIRYTVCMTIIGILFSGVFTSMAYLMKQSEKFYNQIRVFKKEAEDATTPDELKNTLKELLDYTRSHASIGIQAQTATEVWFLINNRLVYEFKEKSNNK